MSAEPMHLREVESGPSARSPEAPPRIEALHAGPIGAAAAGAVACAGVIAARSWHGPPDPAWLGVALFIGVVVQQDTRDRKIPNWLTGLGLFAAIASHGVEAGAAGAGIALIHALVPFGLLILPFALGAIGAGDVKVFMVLGASFGTATTLVLIAWTLIIAGAIAVVWLWSQGELSSLVERAWSRVRGGLRRDPDVERQDHEAPARGQALASALPLGAAIAIATMLQAFLEGGPR